MRNQKINKLECYNSAPNQRFVCFFQSKTAFLSSTKITHEQVKPYHNDTANPVGLKRCFVVINNFFDSILNSVRRKFNFTF